MKLLLYVLIALAIYWLWRQSRLPTQRQNPPAAPPPEPPLLPMVTCARCGVHVPRSEAFADGPGGQAPFYCCAEHRHR